MSVDACLMSDELFICTMGAEYMKSIHFGYLANLTEEQGLLKESMQLKLSSHFISFLEVLALFFSPPCNNAIVSK